MNFSVQILGSNSALAAHGRHPTAQIVQHDNLYFLVDCGEGTQMRMSNYHVKRFKIKHIFISHLHGDHYFGLIGLLTTYHLMGRVDQLTIFGPAHLEKIIAIQLEGSNTTLKYELKFVYTQDEKKELLLDTNELLVYSFPLKHRIPTTGFLFIEKGEKRRINGEKTQGLNLVKDDFENLKLGRNVILADGRELENADYTFPPHSIRSYAFCSDTIYNPELKQYIKGVDLLYHETTFTKECQQRAKETNHSTTEQAAQIANIVSAKKLLIGHFSSKYMDLNILLNECKEIFPNSEVAIEGVIFEINR